MTIGSLPIIEMMKQRMQWLTQRQQVLAQNVANADTPGYTARDLKELDFGALVKRSGPVMTPVATQAMHIGSPAAGSGMGFRPGQATGGQIVKKPDYETTPGGDPYQRKVPTFQQKLDREIGTHVVSLGRPVFDKTEFQLKYLPGHPGADENGYVKMPNVNGMVEAMDMREAQRSYEANLNLIQASRRMISQTIEILRK